MKALPVFKLTETELRPGTSLIEASAGTGKTYTIAGLFLRLILEKHLTVREILVVTYTVAATEELRHRIRQTLARALQAFASGATEDPFLQALLKKHAGQRDDLVARLDRALYGFDEAPIYTIHGFCQRVLQDRAFETGSLFDTELVTDQTALLRQLVEDYWRKQFYRAGRLPVMFALKNALSPDALLPLVRSCLSHPFLKLLSPVDGQDAAALAAKLEDIFTALQEVWRADKEAIRAPFGSGAEWAKQPYNDDDIMVEAFRQLDHCLGALDFPPATLEALRLFRSSAIAEGTRKKAKAPAPAHRFFDLCEELARAEERYVIGLKLGAYRYVEQVLPHRKDELKIQFFDDLLRRLHSTLAGDRGHGAPTCSRLWVLGDAGGMPAPRDVVSRLQVGAPAALATLLRRQYAAALIDEFQDTDPLQYDIFRRVFAGPQNHLFLIGDPKQSIYGFRGADIFTYLQASKQADQSYTLSENWRSESGLVRSLNTVFGESPLPFVFEGIRFQPVEARGAADKHPLTVDGQAQPPFQLWFWPRTGKVITKGAANEKLPAVVASEIVALLNGKTALGGRALLPEDIAVLVPDNYQAQLVQDALSERRIPSVLHTTASLFGSREVLETQRVLAAIADPTRESELMAALATDLLGYSGSQIEALAKQDAEWQQILERFRDYLGLWLHRGFIQMFRSFMQREQVRPRLLAFPDGERRLTNLLHLAEVLHRASSESRLGVSGLLKWIAEQREALDQTNEEHQLRLETDEKAVKLVTIHKSKGLEYPVVFCPFSWKGASVEHDHEEQVFFHDPGDGTLMRDLGGPDYEAHLQLARVERLAENVRLLYVALTRAKHRCYFVWGGFRDAETSAPARLLHPPPADTPDAVTAQKEHFEALDDSRLLGDLHKLAEQSGGADGDPTIAVQNLPEPTAVTAAAASAPAATLDYRKFSGSIARDWRISSFTSLTANRSEELPDYDELGAGRRTELPATGIFAFPGGAKPGTCLHKIIELLDFTQWNQPATRDLVHGQLRAHGLAADEFTQTVLDMLERLMTVPLDERVPGLTLGRITALQRLRELEFYFPLQRLAPEPLRALLREYRLPGERDSGGEPEGFCFPPVRGLLKGFIDLVFEFQNRFYVVDWKSNLLGNRIEDYSAAALADEIRRRHYYFQYQLYTAALDRYLRLRLPGYSYEQHFGGVYYLFLRGIDPARPGFGIHRDRLPEAFVRKLNGMLSGEVEGAKP